MRKQKEKSAIKVRIKRREPDELVEGAICHVSYNMHHALYNLEKSVKMKNIIREIEEAYIATEENIFGSMPVDKPGAVMKYAEEQLHEILPFLRGNLEKNGVGRGYQEDYKACSSAVLSLGFLGDQASVSKIKELLDDERVYIRANAAVALGFLQNNDRIKDIREMLGHKDPLIRRSAALSLALLKDRNSFKKIKEIAEYEGDAGYEIKHLDFATELIAVCEDDKR